MDVQRYRFGLFELNAATSELRRAGTLVKLQAQPAQALVYLVAHAGQVVSRGDLQRAVWGSETHVDFERGLNFCIAQIRSALHDDSSNPIFVRTVAKQGYEFIAPVERIGAQGVPASETVAVNGAPQARSFRKSRKIALLAAVLVASLVAAIGYRSYARSHRPIVAVLRFDNETGDPSVDTFANALTDNVVERLVTASGDHYFVVGNARVLWTPREQRNLRDVAASLHASYIVLGQIQSKGEGGNIRVLAHLIRMPEQTHLWVYRTELALDDPLAAESELAQKIASDFAPRLSQVPGMVVWSASASR